MIADSKNGKIIVRVVLVFVLHHVLVRLKITHVVHGLTCLSDDLLLRHLMSGRLSYSGDLLLDSNLFHFLLHYEVSDDESNHSNREYGKGDWNNDAPWRSFRGVLNNSISFSIHNYCFSDNLLHNFWLDILEHCFVNIHLVTFRNYLKIWIELLWVILVVFFPSSFIVNENWNIGLFSD